MIYVGRQDKILVAVQKSNNTYTYLHWRAKNNSSNHLTRWSEKLGDTFLKPPIGPDCLVEWVDE